MTPTEPRIYRATNPRHYWAPNLKGTVLGLVIAGVVGGVSAALYANAESNGGTYFVFYGAIAWGLWRAVRSLFRREERLLTTDEFMEDRFGSSSRAFVAEHGECEGQHTGGCLNCEIIRARVSAAKRNAEREGVPVEAVLAAWDARDNAPVVDEATEWNSLADAIARKETAERPA